MSSADVGVRPANPGSSITRKATWTEAGSGSPERSKEAKDGLGPGLAEMELPVGREFGDPPRDDAAIPKPPPVLSLCDGLAVLLKQGPAISFAAARDWIPAMGQCR
jgi:hypothetical protein